MTEALLILMMWALAWALAVVLHVMHHNTILAFHQSVLDNALMAPKNAAQRFHMRRHCDTCSLVAELAIVHARWPRRAE